MGYISDLSNDWRESGICNGDMILLHSNISYTCLSYFKKGINLTLDDLLSSFLKAIGEKGTLLLPLFNFDFTKGIPFNIQTTPSKMGNLTEFGRKYPGAVRTGHPIYSFAVIGFKSDLFKNINNKSGYGKDSPFAILHENYGKIAVLNLSDQDSMTFYHYVEEYEKVPYRYLKIFKGEYTGWNGIKQVREYSLYVRDLEMGAVTYLSPMEEYLWHKGLYKGSKFNEGTRMRVIDSKILFNEVSTIIKENKYENMIMRYDK